MSTKIEISLLSLSSVTEYNIHQNITIDNNVLKYIYLFLSGYHYIGYLTRLSTLISLIIYPYIVQRSTVLKNIHRSLLNITSLICEGLSDGRTIELDMSRYAILLVDFKNNRNIDIEKLNKLAPLTSKGIYSEGRDNCFNKDVCDICLDNLTKKQLGRILPCYHVFHACCVDEWIIKSHSSCPVCKKNI